MKKILRALLVCLLLTGILSATANAIADVQPKELEQPEQPEIHVTLKNIDPKSMTERKGPDVKIIAGAKMLWVINIENASETTLNDYTLRIKIPGNMAATSVVESETNDNTMQFAIDGLEPGATKQIPIIIKTTQPKGLFYRDSHNRLKFNSLQLTARAILTKNEIAQNKPLTEQTRAYASNEIQFTYREIRTIGLV